MDDSKVLQILLIFTLAVLFLTAILWPVAVLLRRHYGKTLDLAKEDRRYRTLAKIAALLCLIFLIAFSLMIVMGFQSITALSSKTDNVFRLLNLFGLIAAVGCVIAIYNAIRSWKSRSRWIKITDTFIALGCIGFLWILFVGRLFIFNLNY
jgi:hypothetical protein